MKYFTLRGVPRNLEESQLRNASSSQDLNLPVENDWKFYNPKTKQRRPQLHVEQLAARPVSSLAMVSVQCLAWPGLMASSV